MFFSNWFGPSLTRVPGNTGVALTFDDGPSESTPYVLDILAEYNVKATFFLVGMNVLRLPDIARRVIAEGHEIGNHTWSHANFYRRAPWQVGSEIRHCQKVLADTLGVQPRWFRPPYGVRWFGLFPALKKADMGCAMWSLDTCDWRDPANAIIDRGTMTMPGEVVLLHDGFRTNPGHHRAETVKALPRILSHYRDRHFELRTLDQKPSTDFTDYTD